MGTGPSIGEVLSDEADGSEGTGGALSDLLIGDRPNHDDTLFPSAPMVRENSIVESVAEKGILLENNG